MTERPPREPGAWVRAKYGDGEIDVLPDLVVPARWTMIGLLIAEADGVEVDLEQEWDADRKQLSTRVLTIHAARGLTATQLHGLARISTITAGNHFVQVRAEDGTLSPFGVNPDHLARMKADGPTDETLLWVARLYAASRSYGQAPNKSVVGYFDINQRTATRWIAKARKAGLLD